MNMVWVLFNIVILGVAAAVALEQKQRRGSVRIEAKLPLRITTPGGRQIDTVSIDMSVGGASVTLPSNSQLTSGDMVSIAFPMHTGTDEIRGQVVGIVGGSLRIAFQLGTIAEQEVLTRALYSRADAWLHAANLKEVDRPLISLGRVMVLSTYGIYQVCRSLFPEKKKPTGVTRVKTAAIILGALALGTCGRAFASGEQHDSTLADKASAPNLADSGDSSNPVGENHQVISLKNMGVNSAIEMRGPHSYSAVHFTLSHQWVPKQGTLNLNFSIDPNLDPLATSLQIDLNGTTIATLHPTPSAGNRDGLANIKIPVSSVLLVRNNALTFEFKGSEVMEREEQARAHVLCRLFSNSTFEVDGEWLRLGNDLSHLPLPLFDRELQTTTTIPFVFLTPASATMLEAAGTVASWFGVMSESQPPRFAVSLSDVPAGNAVVLTSNRSMLPESFQIPAGIGPVLAVRNNPNDPIGSLLVIAGDNENDVLEIARTLTLERGIRAGDSATGSNLTGDTLESPSPIMAATRSRDDAPRWLPVSKAAPLANCPSEGSFQTDGSSPIPIYFHTPPDLFYGEKQNLDLYLNYSYDARLIAPGSALRVTVNGALVAEIPLSPGAGTVNHQRLVLIPVEDMQSFGNTVLFSFDFEPASHDPASNSVLSGEIHCDSALDLHGLGLWTPMPNLQLFADAGFPFTQYADLSRTTVVLPNSPSPAEIALYLQLMSHFGFLTGYPALRVTVTGPSNVISEGLDYLVIGTITDQPAFSSLAPLLPATLDGAGVHTRAGRGFSAEIAAFQSAATNRWLAVMGRKTASTPTPAELGLAGAVVQEVQSPVSPDRSIVTITLRQDSIADQFTGTFLDSSRPSDTSGSMILVGNATLKSLPSNVASYHVGDITGYARMRIFLTQYFMALLIVALGLSFLCARFAHGWMAWHASERLKLAAAVDDSNGSDQMTES
jgi:cellulose synthase (UDP-forming)